MRAFLQARPRSQALVITRGGDHGLFCRVFLQERPWPACGVSSARPGLCTPWPGSTARSPSGDASGAKPPWCAWLMRWWMMKRFVDWPPWMRSVMAWVVVFLFLVSVARCVKDLIEQAGWSLTR